MSETVIVFKSGLLGDTLVAVPALRVLRRKWPEARIVYIWTKVTGRRFVTPPEILNDSKLVDDFHEYEEGGSLFGRSVSYLRLWCFCFWQFAFLGVVLEPAYFSSRKKWFLRSCGVRMVVGPNGDIDQIPRDSKGAVVAAENIVDSLLNLVSAIGNVGTAWSQSERWLDLSSKEREWASEWVCARVGGAAGKFRLIALAPGTNMATKRWPREHFERVVQGLIATYGVIPVVFGGAEERELGEWLIERWSSGINAAGELSVRQGVAVLQCCEMYLGNDTGTMHMAVAAGIPCVAIFSSISVPGRWDPYGPGHIVLRTSVPCAGCMLRECDKGRDQCILQISSEAVERACCEVLRRPGNGKNGNLPL